MCLHTYTSPNRLLYCNCSTLTWSLHFFKFSSAAFTRGLQLPGKQRGGRLGSGSSVGLVIWLGGSTGTWQLPFLQPAATPPAHLFGELQPRPSSAPWFSPPGFQQRGNSCCSLTALHSHQAKLEQASRCHLLPLDSSNRTSRQLVSKSHVSAAGLVLTRRHAPLAARTNSKK